MSLNPSEIPQDSPFPLEFKNVDHSHFVEHLQKDLESKSRLRVYTPFNSSPPDHNNQSAKVRGMNEWYPKDAVSRALYLAQYDADPAISQDDYDVLTPALLAHLSAENQAVSAWANSFDLARALNVQDGRDIRTRLWAQAQHLLEEVIPLIPPEIFTQYCQDNNLPQPIDADSFRMVLNNYITHSDY